MNILPERFKILTHVVQANLIGQFKTAKDMLEANLQMNLSICMPHYAKNAL